MVRLGTSVRKRTEERDEEATVRASGRQQQPQGGGGGDGGGEMMTTPTKPKPGAAGGARTVSPSPEADRTALSTPPSVAPGSGTNKSKQQSESRRRLARDVAALADSSTDDDATSQICARLVTATRSPRARADFTDLGGTSALIAAFQRHHATNRRIAEAGCIILQNLAVDPDQCRRIANARGVHAVVSAMKAHPDDEPVQELGCAALRNLGSGDASTKSSIAAAGGILVIVRSMRRHSASVNVQEQAMRALRNLAKDSSSNKVSIAGTVPAIIESMGRHLNSVPVQREGCATLRNLSVSPDNQVAIAACGGVSAILSALVGHPKEEKVQVQGCGALFNMSFSPLALASMKKEQKNLKKVLKNANKRFKDTCGKYVQGITDRLPYASRAGDGATTAWPIPIDLAAVSAKSDGDSTSTGKDGGVSPTLKVLSHIHRLSDHLSDHTASSEDEIKTAIAELARLAVNYDHRIAISAAGGITVIIDVMAQRIDSPSIQRVGCSAIQNLSCNEDNELIIAEQGGISAIIAAMDMYPDNVKLQHKACAALRNLAAGNNDNRNQIRSDGGIRSILSCMRSFDLDKHVQEVTCSALGNLCLQNDDNRILLGSSGAVTRILLALMTHPDAPGVQEKGCRALYNLSLSPANVKLIQSEEPETILWDAASKFPTECGEWTQRLLQKL